MTHLSQITSGQVGCLYDSGPEFVHSKEDAIEELVGRFDDYFRELGQAHNHKQLHENRGWSNDEWEELNIKAERIASAENVNMRRSLAVEGIFHFSRPDLAGADYCEVNDLDS